MKKKYVLIMITVLALSVTSVIHFTSPVAASSLLGGNKNNSILDALTPTPEPGKPTPSPAPDTDTSFGGGDSLSANMSDSLMDLVQSILSRVGDEEMSLLNKVLSQTDDDLLEDDEEEASDGESDGR